MWMNFEDTCLSKEAGYKRPQLHNYTIIKFIIGKYIETENRLVVA